MEASQFRRIGQTRSVLKRDHALIAPDSHVPAPLPAWSLDGTAISGVVLIAPVMGARFAQTMVLLDSCGDLKLQPAPGVERFIYVLEGALTWDDHALRAGSFCYLPPSTLPEEARVTQAGRLIVFEKIFAPRAGFEMPQRIIGHADDVEGKPFLGDLDARLKTLLPDVAAFDMAVNVFTYQPGARLPFVETHVMEHGLTMLAGEGIYRLGDHWYPVAQGDTIWMASYCPQWFAAIGKTPASYLYYKDVNRETLRS